MKGSISASDRILDIAVNLARVANWTADSYEKKQHLIKFFLNQTDDYLSELHESKVSKNFKPVLKMFKMEFAKLKKDDVQKDKDWWAERALTWANILTHRAKLA